MRSPFNWVETLFLAGIVAVLLLVLAAVTVWGRSVDLTLAAGSLTHRRSESSSPTAFAPVHSPAGVGGSGEDGGPAATSEASAPASTTTVEHARVEGAMEAPATDEFGHYASQSGAGSSSTNAGSTPAPSATALVKPAEVAPALTKETGQNLSTPTARVEASSLAPYEVQARAAIDAAFPPAQRATAMRVAGCETGGTYSPGAVGRAGERGIFQVRPEYHGAVPADVYGQAVQAAGIVAKSGWGPWSCR